MKNDMNGSEAVFGLMAWLTTRDIPVTFSSHHDAARAADMAKAFCETNNLEPVRDDKYPNNLTLPD